MECRTNIRLQIFSGKGNKIGKQFRTSGHFPVRYYWLKWIYDIRCLIWYFDRTILTSWLWPDLTKQDILSLFPFAVLPAFKYLRSYTDICQTYNEVGRQIHNRRWLRPFCTPHVVLGVRFMPWTSWSNMNPHELVSPWCIVICTLSRLL